MPKKKPATAHRYTEAEQRHAAEQVLLLGVSMTQVAKEMKCSPISVKTWVEKFRGQTTATATAETPVAHKTAVPRPVKTATKHDDSSKIELVTPSGVTMRFPISTSPATLSSVAKQLDQ